MLGGGAVACSERTDRSAAASGPGAPTALTVDGLTAPLGLDTVGCRVRLARERSAARRGADATTRSWCQRDGGGTRRRADHARVGFGSGRLERAGVRPVLGARTGVGRGVPLDGADLGRRRPREPGARARDVRDGARRPRLDRRLDPPGREHPNRVRPVHVRAQGVRAARARRSCGRVPTCRPTSSTRCTSTGPGWGRGRPTAIPTRSTTRRSMSRALLRPGAQRGRPVVQLAGPDERSPRGQAGRDRRDSRHASGRHASSASSPTDPGGYAEARGSIRRPARPRRRPRRLHGEHRRAGRARRLGPARDSTTSAWTPATVVGPAGTAPWTHLVSVRTRIVDRAGARRFRHAAWRRARSWPTSARSTPRSPP